MGEAGPAPEWGIGADRRPFARIDARSLFLQQIKLADQILAEDKHAPMFKVR